MEQVWYNTIVEGSAAKRLTAKLRSLRQVIKDWTEHFYISMMSGKQRLICWTNFCTVLEEDELMCNIVLDQKGANIEELNETLNEEETLWKQRPKVHWLKEGDGNSGYFHKITNGRRRSNTILSIVSEGAEVTDQRVIDCLWIIIGRLM